MTAPVTLAVLLCPICKDVDAPAQATFRWIRTHSGGRMPELIGYDCPNGCSLDDADDDERRPSLSIVANSK
jgi:hypothetical protein